MWSTRGYSGTLLGGISTTLGHERSVAVHSRTEPGFDDSSGQLAIRAEAIASLQELVHVTLADSRAVELIALEADVLDAPNRCRQVRVTDLADVSFAFLPPEIAEIAGAA